MPCPRTLIFAPDRHTTSSSIPHAGPIHRLRKRPGTLGPSDQIIPAGPCWTTIAPSGWFAVNGTSTSSNPYGCTINGWVLLTRIAADLRTATAFKVADPPVNNIKSLVPLPSWGSHGCRSIHRHVAQRCTCFAVVMRIEALRIRRLFIVSLPCSSDLRARLS